jgi:hypothetical protein
MKTPKYTVAQSEKAIEILRDFIPRSELQTIASNRFGEEGQFFIDKICSIAELIKGMPETGGQNGKGKKAVAFLHYFRGSVDSYITEKDIGDSEDEPGEGQIQAFGAQSLGFGFELGYISIKELIENNVELDLYFEPKTLEDLNIF